MHAQAHMPPTPPPLLRITLIRCENVFTGSVAEPQGLQGLLQEDEGAKDPLSSSATERCTHYSVSPIPNKQCVSGGERCDIFLSILTRGNKLMTTKFLVNTDKMFICV